MYAVEIAYRDDGTGQLFGDVINVSYYFHNPFREKILVEKTNMLRRSTIARIALFSRVISLDNIRVSKYKRSIVFSAEVAELVDALGSGSSGLKPVRVQISASAPYSQKKA